MDELQQIIRGNSDRMATFKPNTNIMIQIRHHIPRFLLLASGISGILFFTTVDFMRPGESPQFGTDQLAGFVISTIIVLASIHSTQSPRAKTWFGALLVIYLVGILYMGLKPSDQFHKFSKEFLTTSSPPIYDFVINILGFIPFAYLSMAYFFAKKRMDQIVPAALITLAAGISVSLFIELVQYDIPGRTSSLMDLIANTAGTSIGTAYFLIEKKLAPYR